MTLFSGFEKLMRRDEPLAPHTWFRVGGPAEYFAEPNNAEELAALVRRCCDQGIEFHLLGSGSNVLVSDAGVRGVVIRLASPTFCDIIVAKNLIGAGAGAKLGHLISSAVREGLAGIESLVGIPGTVGGALAGNAGSHGGDIGQWVTQATVMSRTGELTQRTRGQMEFAYRQSSLDDGVILSAQFQLEFDDPVELTKRMQKQWIIKKASQPLADESAGCIFKNPRGMSAGALIDQAGLKSARVGGAEVSQRHANFFTADPGATSADIRGLIDYVRDRVADRMGVELELALRVW